MIKSAFLLAILTIGCSCLTDNHLLAQGEVDSTSDIRLFFKLNSRRSIVSGEKISIRGFRIGAEFNEKHRVGVGIFDSGLFGLNGGGVVDFFDLELSPRPLDVQVDIGYITIFYEYVLWRDKKWHVTFDHQWGIGKAKKRFRDVNGVLLSTKRVTKPLVEATFELQYKIRPWLNTSAGLGYRYILDREDETIMKTFNSPIYVLKIRVSTSYFLRKMIAKKKTRSKDS